MSDIIAAGLRIGLLMEDEVVVAALADLKKANYDLFVKAKSDEDRVMAQARAQVLDTFEQALRAIVDGGERETLERERRERAPATR